MECKSYNLILLKPNSTRCVQNQIRWQKYKTVQFKKDSGENRKYGDGHVHVRAVLADKLFSWDSQLKVRTQKPELYRGAVCQE
jgi:hypothetical protein